MSPRLIELDEIAVFDLETTGVELESARIVTAYLGMMGRDGVITQSKSWLVNPGIPIPEGASAIHGITTEFAVEHGMDASAAAADMKRILDQIVAQGIPVVAFNARYDMTVFDRTLMRAELEALDAEKLRAIDPHVIDLAIDPYRKGRRTLAVTCTQYGVSLTDAHNADADAIAAGHLAFRILARLDQDETLDQLHFKQVARAATQAASKQKHFQKTNPLSYVEPQWPMVLRGS